jgi:hypothetical protein
MTPAGPPPAMQHVVRIDASVMAGASACAKRADGANFLRGQREQKLDRPRLSALTANSLSQTERNMFRNTPKIGWFRRALMATAFVGAGALTLGATSSQAQAQYYPYGYGYSPYYGYPYYSGYYPSYGYPYGYGYGYGYPVGVSVGWGYGWHGGWGGGWHGHR